MPDLVQRFHIRHLLNKSFGPGGLCAPPVVADGSKAGLSLYNYNSCTDKGIITVRILLLQFALSFFFNKTERKIECCTFNYCFKSRIYSFDNKHTLCVLLHSPRRSPNKSCSHILQSAVCSLDSVPLHVGFSFSPKLPIRS